MVVAPYPLSLRPIRLKFLPYRCLCRDLWRSWVLLPRWVPVPFVANGRHSLLFSFAFDKGEG